MEWPLVTFCGTPPHDYCYCMVVGFFCGKSPRRDDMVFLGNFVGHHRKYHDDTTHNGY